MIGSLTIAMPVPDSPLTNDSHSCLCQFGRLRHPIEDFILQCGRHCYLLESFDETLMYNKLNIIEALRNILTA